MWIIPPPRLNMRAGMPLSPHRYLLSCYRALHPVNRTSLWMLYLHWDHYVSSIQPPPPRVKFPFAASAICWRYSSKLIRPRAGLCLCGGGGRATMLMCQVIGQIWGTRIPAPWDEKSPPPLPAPLYASQTLFMGHLTAWCPLKLVRIVKHSDYWIVVGLNRKWSRRLPASVSGLRGIWITKTPITEVWLHVPTFKLSQPFLGSMTNAHKTNAHKTNAHKTNAHKTNAHKTNAHKTYAHNTNGKRDICSQLFL